MTLWILKKITSPPLNQTSSYHFTPDVNIALMIMKFGQLRLSNLNKMKKDEKEGKHILDSFKNVLNRLLDKKVISKSEYDKLLYYRYGLNQYSFVLLRNNCMEYVSSPITPYVVSFTENVRSAKMWNEFGSNSSIALGFNISRQKYPLKLVDGPNPFLIPYRVIYEDNEFEIILEK